MSRGERVAVGASQNLNLSMRQNYDEFGVEEYYKKVGATYRNPHYPGIRTSLFVWFNKWWEMEGSKGLGGVDEPSGIQVKTLLFDMACGSGEVTEAFKDWYTSGRAEWKLENTNPGEPSGQSAVLQDAQITNAPIRPVVPKPRRKALRATVIGPDFPEPLVTAADPFTAGAYSNRTTYPCATLSFKDIGEGALPPTSTNVASGAEDPLQVHDGSELSHGSEPLIEVVICSFALHLIQSPSELFTLLWELSTKARWLVILAPHKKPEIKDGWGWMKWDITSWNEAPMHGQAGELLNDRVHCRAYKSTHFA